MFLFFTPLPPFSTFKGCSFFAPAAAAAALSLPLLSPPRGFRQVFKNAKNIVVSFDIFVDFQPSTPSCCCDSFVCVCSGGEAKAPQWLPPSLPSTYRGDGGPKSHLIPLPSLPLPQRWKKGGGRRGRRKGGGETGNCDGVEEEGEEMLAIQLSSFPYFLVPLCFLSLPPSRKETGKKGDSNSPHHSSLYFALFWR